ncbi:MAG: thioredoxin-disulfide reductase [Faecalimonas sp.]|nr:thioredoxin-disulfide reductase [Faecalimonas sp.]
MENKQYDVIIIGGGPGGYTAALYAARANLSVLVLEKFSPGGQMATTDMVENYPGFVEGINGFELGMQMKQGAERFGVKTKLAEVRSADLEANPKVVNTAKESFEAKTVILATGAFPRELGLPNESSLRGRGVSYCATCDGMFYKGKTVVIVGGGNTAVADAIFLAKICKKVYLVHRRDELRASKTYMAALEKTENIEFVWSSEVVEIQAEQFVTGVKVRSKKDGAERDIACDGVFVAVGNIPNTDLIKGQITLDEAGYVLSDETTKTNIEGVFAVGDMRAKPLRQIVTAVADGAVAAKYAEEFIDAEAL